MATGKYGKDKPLVESPTAHALTCSHCLLNTCPLTPRSRPQARTAESRAHASRPLSTQQKVRPPMVQLGVKLTQCSGRHCCSRRSRSTAVRQCRVLTRRSSHRERLLARDAPRYGAQHTCPRELAGVLAGRSREDASTIVTRSGSDAGRHTALGDSREFHSCGWAEERCSGYRWVRGVAGDDSVIFLRYVVRSVRVRG